MQPIEVENKEKGHHHHIYDYVDELVRFAVAWGRRRERGYGCLGEVVVVGDTDVIKTVALQVVVEHCHQLHQAHQEKHHHQLLDEREE